MTMQQPDNETITLIHITDYVIIHIYLWEK